MCDSFLYSVYVFYIAFMSRPIFPFSSSGLGWPEIGSLRILLSLARRSLSHEGNNWASEHNTIRYHSISVFIALSQCGAPFGFQYQDPVFCKEMDSIPVPDIKPSFSPLFSSFSLLGSVIPFSLSSFRGAASSTSSLVLSERSCRLFTSLLQPISE